MTPSDAASPLAGINYGRRAHDLSRFVGDPADDTIAEVVRAASALSTEGRDALRSILDEDDCYRLLTFARRRSASAIRDASLAEALDAIQALTLVTHSKIDVRDLSVDFPLYALGRLGGDLAAAVENAKASSERGTRGAFTARARWAGSLTLKDCGLREVTSTYGLGFMDTWSERYAPRSDLAGMAVRMADLIDRAGRYVVDDVHLSSLPSVWFDPSAKPGISKVPAAGCVSLSAWIRGGSEWGAGLLVFFAEVDSARVATSLVARVDAASTRDHPMVAGSDGCLLLLLIGGSWSVGEESVETEASLEVTRDALLREVQAPG